MADDLLDSVLNLEDTSYQEGFDEGRADGDKAGREEGMLLGIEKGYQKALQMGKLHGRAMMVNACISDPTTDLGSGRDPSTLSSTTESSQGVDSETEKGNHPVRLAHLPTLPDNQRLRKHIDTLLKLTDAATLTLNNSDEAVEEFDERMKKAKAKAKVIDKLIAETHNLSVSGDAPEQKPKTAGSGNIEELGNLAVRR